MESYAAMLVAISSDPDLSDFKSRDDSRDCDIAPQSETIDDEASKTEACALALDHYNGCNHQSLHRPLKPFPFLSCPATIGER